MKTAKQLKAMSTKDLQRLAARLQVEVAKQARNIAGGGHPDDWDEADATLSAALRVKREVYKATRPRCGGTLHYEHFMGTTVRLYRTEGRKRLYRFKCPDCGAYGENNGRPLRCTATARKKRRA